jgi:tetratricopeptide (TPR) repeat protein
MSVSRGGALACLVGLALFFALCPRRLAALVSGAVAGAGGAVAVLALLSRPSLRAGLQRSPTLSAERHQMLGILAAVSLAVAAVADGLRRLGASRRPGAARTATTPGRPPARARAGGVAVTAGLVLVIVLLVGSGEADHLWREFQQPYVRGAGDVYSRLLTLSGSHRYQFWEAAVSAWNSSPWRGIGPGTFEFWWAQHNSLSEFVRNAHSLYFETLAELGVVGLALLAALIMVTLVAGARAALGAVTVTRSALAASIAGFGGFAAAAGFDWVWQFAAIPTVGLLLAAGALAGPRTGATVGARTRAVLGLAAVPALLAIAVPLATTVAVRSSQAEARAGNYGRALADLSAARRLEPAAASPRLQQALIYEQAGAIPAANRAIGQALGAEPTNWRIWLVASRLAAEDGRPGLAVSEFRRARALNPTSAIFRR